MLFFKWIWTIFSLGTPVLRKLFDIRFSYNCKHCNFSRVSLFASSETQLHSVGLGEKAGRKFSSTGKRATGYLLSPNYFQNSSGCRLLIGHKKFFVLLCPIGEQFLPSFFFMSSYKMAIVLPHLPGSFTKLVRARRTFIFNFPNQKQRKVWGAISRSNSICPENILFLTDHNVS